MLFTKSDFKENWLNFSENFKIPKEKAIYLGPNGIGKTTIYKVIKEKNPLLGFFSYDECKEKILKEKKKLKICIRTTDIEKLNREKQDIVDDIDLKNTSFKKHNITSSVKAGEYSKYCKDVYSNNEKGILEFENVGLEALLDYKSSKKKKFILQNSNELKMLKIKGNELEEIRNKYILDAYEMLEKAIDDEITICPVCGYDHQKSILEIYKIKKQSYQDTLDELIDKYRIETKETKSNIKNDIIEMMEFVNENNINDKVSTNYILIGNNKDYIDKLLESKSKIDKINIEIKQLEKERENFFNNLSLNWNKINPVLEKVFKDSAITIDINEEEKSITINLTREAITYSTGELNYIVFLLNILEFEYSNKDTIIIDDPLCSFDIKKQYEIVFDIINRLSKKGKTVIIFTHNINLINIINSQHPTEFPYKSIDAIKNTLYLYDIKLPKEKSVLNIENLLQRISDENTLKKWLELLVEKDSWGGDCDYHKLFHYNYTYTHPLNNCSNDELVKLIDDFDGNIDCETFEELSLQKIIYLAALRVWLEKQMLDNLNGDFGDINELFPKIKYFFENKNLWINDLDIEREDLIRKKVLLNQNSHYKSQIIPFHYALSISSDDLSAELLELKEIFKISKK